MCDTQSNSPVLEEPLKFKPIIHSKIWGGTKIRDFFGKNIDVDNTVGESWELSDNETEISIVSEGMYKDQSFRDIFRTFSREILGECYSGKHEVFPLLFKFIDASKDLSVQVHPGENSRLGDSKTEAWYVVEAGSGAEIIVGLNSNREPGEILEALKTSQARDVLNSIPVAKGDILFIPAGTVHAITEGLLIYEVQQNSDTTFRLYDWDRVDDTGRPRELHVQQASEVLDFTVHDDHKIKTLSVEHDSFNTEYLVVCDYFAMSKYYNFSSSVEIEMNNRFKVITNMTNEIKIIYRGGACSLHKGETVLIPASCRKVKLEGASQDTELIVSHIPNIIDDVIEPLKFAGYSDDEISQLGGRKKLVWS